MVGEASGGRHARSQRQRQLDSNDRSLRAPGRKARLRPISRTRAARRYRGGLMASTSRCTQPSKQIGGSKFRESGRSLTPAMDAIVFSHRRTSLDSLYKLNHLQCAPHILQRSGTLAIQAWIGEALTPRCVHTVLTFAGIQQCPLCGFSSHPSSQRLH